MPVPRRRKAARKLAQQPYRYRNQCRDDAAWNLREAAVSRGDYYLHMIRLRDARCNRLSARIEGHRLP